MYTQPQIDPLVSFRNAEGEAVRGTLVNLQRRSLIMEVYNPYSIVQVSEVLSELTVRFGANVAYQGKAVVTSLLNTGLTAIVSVTLTDRWQELEHIALVPGMLGEQARAFIADWARKPQIRQGYQLVVNEMRAYLSDVSRWVEQVDLAESLPKDAGGRLREDIFMEFSAPLVEKTRHYMDLLEDEAAQVEEDTLVAHRNYAQTALHPLLLRAPFIFRTYTKPLGYAGDYEMVNQIISDPRQGPSTYFQMVNAAFLQTAVAAAHRNRIDLLVAFLKRMADTARKTNRTIRILNVGCGPAIEIQRFIREYPQPEHLSFELMDFNQDTLDWTRARLTSICTQHGKQVTINYINDSVHKLLKRRVSANPSLREFNAVYCAGLFDYLSDKVCARLLALFASQTLPGGNILVTNVHSSNPMKFVMEHLLEWYLIYRDEDAFSRLNPVQSDPCKLYTDPTGVNIFMEIPIS